MPRKRTGPRLDNHRNPERTNLYIFWTDETGRSRERSTGTTCRDEAEIVFAQFLRDRQRKEGGASDTAATLITDLIYDYLEERSPHAADADRLAYAAIPLSDFWEGKTVSQITRQSCLEYCQWRKRADGTMRRELGMLRAVINHAINEGRLTGNVVIHLPEKPEPKERWLTRSEAAALLRAARRQPDAKDYLPRFILIGLYSGQRKKTVLNLRKQMIYFEGDKIDWNGEAKRTKKRRPLSRMARRLRPHLERWSKDLEPLDFIVHRYKDKRPIKNIKKAFNKAVEDAGLEDVTPHTLRHTCATWLMQKDHDLHEICGYLGMSRTTLETVYGHHSPEFQKGVANAF